MFVTAKSVLECVFPRVKKAKPYSPVTHLSPCFLLRKALLIITCKCCIAAGKSSQHFSFSQTRSRNWSPGKKKKAQKETLWCAIFSHGCELQLQCSNVQYGGSLVWSSGNGNAFRFCGSVLFTHCTARVMMCWSAASDVPAPFCWRSDTMVKLSSAVRGRKVELMWSDVD